MSRKTGFKSGEVHANRVKINGKYINESQFIQQEDFTTIGVSGTAAVFKAVLSGSAQAIPSWTFSDAVQNQVAFKFITPSSLGPGVAPNLKIYWCKLGAASHGNVTWQADYWVTRVLVSGTESAGASYNISGGLTRTGTVSVTDAANQLSSLVSGVIQTVDLKIPSTKVTAGDLVKVQFARFGVGASDTLAENAQLIGILLEYVEG